MKPSCPSSHKKFRRHRSSMAAKQKMMSKEDRCRKNIATFLDFLGFQDVNPNETPQELRKRVRKIKEKQSTIIRKITFKCNGKAPVIIPEDPTTVLETPLSDEGSSGKDIENTKKKTIVMEKDSRKVLPEVENPNLDDQMVITNEDNDDHRIIEQVMDNGGAGGMLRGFIRKIGGSLESMVSVVEKQLTETDVNKHEARLLMRILPEKFRAFLRAPEKERLNGGENIEATVFGPKLRRSKVNLKLWKMKKRQYLVFKTGWNEVVDANELNKDMVLQVWSFRVDEELCFALLRV